MVKWKMGTTPILYSVRLFNVIFHFHDDGRKGSCLIMKMLAVFPDYFFDIFCGGNL